MISHRAKGVLVIDNSVVNETFLGHLCNAVADVTVTVTHTKELLENEKKTNVPGFPPMMICSISEAQERIMADALQTPDVLTGHIRRFCFASIFVQC